MNLYKALIAATTVTLATVPSISAFVPTPVTFAARSQKTSFPADGATIDFTVAPGGASVKPLSMASKFVASQDDKSYPEGMSQEEELDFLRQVAEKTFAGQDDAPDIDELMKFVAASQARAEPDPNDMDTIDYDQVGIASIPCEVGVAIDVIALALEAAGLGGGGAKKVATKMYGKLPRSKKKDLAKILAQMDADNFAESAYEVIKLIYESLTWNSLKDSFSSLGWWDAATFALSFAAIFASGGIAFIIKIALFANSITQLLISIANCEAIVG